ncbi:hypothetical protein HOD29_04710 [archaeon]|jgi:hypothetical protein|nr:hypothetical protein [archaeon]
MKNTYLIQRLSKPTGFVNPFSFGGGLVNGGLSDEAMDLVKDIWDFDYMGSAQFEMGKVPTSLHNIANYSVDNKAYANKIGLDKDVFYICHQDMAESVEKMIRKLAIDERSFGLQDPSFFKQSLKGEKYSDKLGGWLELNNHFMFFVDKEMYARTCGMFGVA